jgi:hypothetical protein
MGDAWERRWQGASCGSCVTCAATAPCGRHLVLGAPRPRVAFMLHASRAHSSADTRCARQPKALSAPQRAGTVCGPAARAPLHVAPRRAPHASVGTIRSPLRASGAQDARDAWAEPSPQLCPTPRGTVCPVSWRFQAPWRFWRHVACARCQASTASPLGSLPEGEPRAQAGGERKFSVPHLMLRRLPLLSPLAQVSPARSRAWSVVAAPCALRSAAAALRLRSP